MTSKNTIFCIMGPTACGKTDLAIRLAQHYPMEIISVDSALVYKGMDIGTGKPSKALLEKVPHHLINICDPKDPYNAGQFREDALKIIESIIGRNHIPLLVGGTMMYFKALLQGLADLPASNLEIRKQLDDKAQAIGWPALHAYLTDIDPLSAQRIKPTDAQRIQRALEVYLVSNKPLSEWIEEANNQSNAHQRFPYTAKSIGFIPTMEQRTILHNRIEQRFLHMLDLGLISEVRHLFDRSDLDVNLPSIRSVGYRQVWEYLLGYYDYETMKQKAISATRGLAKRQITWLRTWPELIEVDFFDEDAAVSQCINLIEKFK